MYLQITDETKYFVSNYCTLTWDDIMKVSGNNNQLEFQKL